MKFDWLPWGRTKPTDEEKGVVLGVTSSTQPFQDGRPREYRSFAEEGYLKNPIIFRCIQEKAKGVASIPVHVYRKDRGKGLERIDNHPLMEFLEAPNPMQSWMQFITHISSYLSLVGEAGIETITSGKHIESYPIRPDQIQKVTGKENMGMPVGYRITAGGRVLDFPVDPITGKSPIAFLNDFNPFNFWRGSGPMSAGALSGDLYNSMARWNLSTMKNGARPSGVISNVVDAQKGRTGKLTPEQRARAKRWIDSMQGEDGASKILLLEDGWQWTQMSQSAKDLDFSQSKINTALDICFAHQVPAQIVGIPNSQTFANYAQARLAFFQETIIPLAKFIYQQINMQIIRWLDEDVCLWFDMDEIPALAAARGELYQSLINANFLTVNEKRKLAGLPQYEESEEPGDQIFAPPSSVPIEDLAGASLDSDGLPDTGDYNEPEGEEEDSSEKPENEDEGNEGDEETD